MCSSALCPYLDAPYAGSVKVSSYYPGGQAVYSCDDGYLLKGDQKRVCLSSGRWEGSDPVCKRTWM